MVGLNPFLQIPVKWSLLIGSFQNKLGDYSLYLTLGNGSEQTMSLQFSSVLEFTECSLVNVAVFCTNKPGDRHRQAAIALNSRVRYNS